MKLLLIEDDSTIGSAVCDHLIDSGHNVDWSQSLASAHNNLAITDYEFIILDMSLPDGLGDELLQQIRSFGSLTPVVIISAHNQISSRIKGLNSGADDYIVKPFNLNELSARMEAVMRRSRGRANSVEHIGSISIDFFHQIISNQGVSIDLSSREWAVLERLLHTKNAIVPKLTIERSLYSIGAEIGSNAVEVYICRLRKQLGKNFIKTIRDMGYQIPVTGK